MITTDRLSSLESMLAGDHLRLDRTFQALVKRAEGRDFEQLEIEWLAFQTALLQHLEAEERNLIPALARDRPGEARALRDDHANLRIRLLQIGVDVDSHRMQAERVDAFVEVMRAHANREENMFYPWVDRRLGRR
jgi:hemerythrin superfamily protein